MKFDYNIYLMSQWT